MSTVLEIIKKSTDFLAGKGIENARFNAEWLIGYALGLKRMQLYVQFERNLTELELEKIRPLLRRRVGHEPLQYILGESVFSGLTLKCDRRALIPRPETEYLVELITQRLKERPPARVLDLGTGTGAIALALARAFPTAEVTAVDASDDALALTSENVMATAMTERVRLLKSNWFSALPTAESFDLVVSNPPYLTLSELAETLPEVRTFEPASALVAGEDGLNDLRTILQTATNYLTSGGMLALETGIAQHAELKALSEAGGLSGYESVKDLTERDRYVFLRKP